MRYLVGSWILAMLLPAAAWAGTPSSHGNSMKDTARPLRGWPADWQDGQIGSPQIPYSLGVNVHLSKPRPGEMKMLAAGGFRWIRAAFLWSVTEKHKGQYDFKPYDTLLASVRPYHIRIMFILCFANPLYQHGQYPSTPKARRAFCRWVAAAVKHFKGHGILWEMWNEPNSLYSPWHSMPSQYMRLAVAVGKTIHHVAPHAMYVGPALSLLDTSSLNFIKRCGQAGLLNYFNAVTVHPYRTCIPQIVGPESAAGDYRRLRAVISHYVPKGKVVPVISGEWGYSSTDFNGNNARQARYAAREFLVNLSQGIPLSIWYDWHDDGPHPKNRENNFGLVNNAYHRGHHPVYTPKAAYYAIQTLSRELNGCHFVRRLKVGKKGDYVLLFHGPRGDCIAAWKVGPKRATVWLPMKPGHYQVTNELGHKTRTVIVSQDAHKLKLTLSHDPEYVVPKTEH